jgi:curved DNA-binding protein CbpA
LKTYYELLEIARDAPADDVKKSFRAQIAKYHPDKVQHLGKEFQAMAADRAAELTEAYRILSHADLRATYDATLGKSAATGVVVSAAPAPAPSKPPAPEPPRPIVQEAMPVAPGPSQFDQERARRDTFVRKATMDRFRQAYAQVAGAGYDEATVRGFDFASVPKARLFGRGKGPALLGRFVSRVDASTVSTAWTDAVRWSAPAGDEICVILMSTVLATARELADAIHEQRRKSARGSSKVITVIPVDSSVWDAHMPTDAPPVAKELLTRLRSGK